MIARRADPARSRILLVGTPAYEDPGLEDVAAIKHNISDLLAVFTDPELGGFEPVHCVAAPSSAGVKEIGDLLVRAASGAEDLLLFYYCGHGLLGRRSRELYLSVAGTDPQQPSFSALPFSAVREACLDSRAGKRVVILDSCFSGRAIGQTLAAGDEEVLGQIEVDGTFTLTSAPSNQSALVLPGERHTAFTERFLELIHEGTSTAGQVLTLTDIYLGLRKRLRAEGLPEPQQRGTGTASFMGLVRNRGYIRPAPAVVQQDTPPAAARRPNALHSADDVIIDDRYRLDYCIDSDGMGEVWACTDLRLSRAVAVKMLSARHSGDEQFRTRFHAGARYAASLSHPGIMSVYAYGENGPLGRPYLVMELVNGEPLSAILERVGRLSAYNTMDVVAQVARALDVAHQADIVHRDIKPRKLLIMGDGTMKITDFGIAAAREWGDQKLTAIGIVMGTAIYLSPEQATGAILTGSSDIYSLGVVAYECLNGEPPFIAEQPLAIAIMHKLEPVPPLPSDVPRQVAHLVMAMLAKTPESRPKSAQHVAERAEALMWTMRSGSGG